MPDEPDSQRTRESVRTCLLLLIGMCYGSKAIRQQVQQTEPYRAHWPKDLVALLEAIEREDGPAVREWFIGKKIVLPDGRIADAIAEYLLDHHRKETTRQSVWTLCRRAQLPPGEMLAGMKALVAELEAAGIQPSENPCT